MRRHEGGNLPVQVELPVHALGNRFDDEVAIAQLLEVLVVVGLSDQRRVFGHAQRRRLELLQPFDSAGHSSVLRTLLCSQVEQDHRHPDIHQVRGDLRAHHAGAQHGDLLHLETGHGHAQASASCVSINTLEPLRAVRISIAVSGNSLAK